MTKREVLEEELTEIESDMEQAKEALNDAEMEYLWLKDEYNRVQRELDDLDEDN